MRQFKPQLEQFAMDALSELRIPKPGTDRLPAVVFVHSSGGIGFNYGMWADELNKARFATFVAGTSPTAKASAEERHVLADWLCNGAE